MGVNPDIAAHEETNKIIGSTVARLPVVGELRFIQRVGENATLRILQQYQWSQVDMNHGWYDVPLEE